MLKIFFLTSVPISKERAFPRREMSMDQPIFESVRKIPSALRAAAARFFADEIPVRAGSLAFSSMLSLVPVAAIGLGVLSNFTSFRGQVAGLKEIVLRVFLPGVGTALEARIDEFLAAADSLSVFGVGALVVSSALLLREIRSAFKAVHASGETVSLRELAFEFWGVLTGIPLAAAAAAWALSELAARFGAEGSASRILPTVLVSTGFVFVLLALFSPKSSKMSSAFVASLLGGPALALAQAAFVRYVSLPILPNLIYGALAVASHCVRALFLGAPVG